MEGNGLAACTCFKDWSDSSFMVVWVWSSDALVAFKTAYLSCIFVSHRGIFDSNPSLHIFGKTLFGGLNEAAIESGTGDASVTKAANFKSLDSSILFCSFWHRGGVGKNKVTLGFVVFVCWDIEGRSSLVDLIDFRAAGGAGMSASFGIFVAMSGRTIRLPRNASLLYPNLKYNKVIYKSDYSVILRKLYPPRWSLYLYLYTFIMQKN